MATKKIAIACQGGGTHAAFTWGVLRTILETKKRWDADPQGGDTFEITAMSGTSAGALCALAAWYGLAPNTADRHCGSIDKAIERLDYLWNTFAARTPAEVAINQVIGGLMNLKSQGVPFSDVGPYDLTSQLSHLGLSMLGVRKEYLGFPDLLRAVCPGFDTIDWPKLAGSDLRVIVGAIEVLSGNFEVFDSNKTLEQQGLMPDRKGVRQYGSTRWRMRRSMSLEGVAASGTLPEVLPAQVIPHLRFPTCDPERTVTRNGYYWDGLYSRNPPVRNLLDAKSREKKPDEIWIIRINPQEFPRPTRRVSLDDIRDRENDLSGNLSLLQELDMIMTVNQWITKYGDAHPPLNTRKVVDVRTIKMTQGTAWGLKHKSKLDRGYDHFLKLREEGRRVTEKWLSDWRELGPDFERYPNDARYPDAA